MAHLDSLILGLGLCCLSSLELLPTTDRGGGRLATEEVARVGPSGYIHLKQ